MKQGPWQITRTAVLEYMAIKTGRRSDTDPNYDRLEAELVEMAERVAAGDQQGRPLDSGATQYRGPRPLRLRLTVVPPSRDQPLPQLVRVQPDHEARSGPYERSAPERQTGHDKRDRRK